MKHVCLICQKDFSGGPHRKTCSLECKKRHTNVKSARRVVNNQQMCLQCKRYFPFKHFSGTNARSRYCKKCWNQRTIDRINNRKAEYVTKFGGKCVRCGYNKYIGALEFHHTNPKQKEQKIYWFSGSLEKLEKELAKCVLVCANCHRELHHEMHISGV